MRQDLQIHDDVLAELAWDPRVDEKSIGLAVSDGVVTLTGMVPSYADKLAAERAAERVAGVRAVANDLTVSITTEATRTDTEIAHAVADSLGWSIEVPDQRIRPSVSNGWVTLEGKVDWRYQRDAALRIAGHIVGVRGVTNNIVVVASGVSAAEVKESIKQALERRADRAADRIVIQANEGVVTLSGTVASYGDRRAAEGAAWSAAGVTDVRDEMSVVL